ncbi:MAG: cyclopropane-fatty-acyl-phospholipid synthase family protein [Gammaproteobacteria bacterium]|nr:cyclopropane-fatty-acyl-phospholipid synthase family protein [Gammaproteobacteria bacterium]
MSDTNKQSLEMSCASLELSSGKLKSAIKSKFATILSGIEDGQLVILWPNGAETRHGTVSSQVAHNVTIEFHSYRPVQRLIFGGAVGFAESYLRAEWSCNNLTNFFSLVMRNENRLFSPTRGKQVSRLARTIRHLLNRNSKRGSQKNISYHYDLGNSFYRLWLDRSMSYSAGVFHDESMTLEQAQLGKMEKIAQMLNASAGERVLEIGCGWGSLAQFLAVKNGCSVDAISLSHQQLDYANAALESNTDISDSSASVEFRHQDYRAVERTYDHIVSVEMFEAVGEEYWKAYFSKVAQLLESGGNVVLQVITILEERFDHYKKNPDFIQRYIFPGGMLPTKTRLLDLIEEAGLQLVDSFWFGEGYAETLRHWSDRFEESSNEIFAQGYDERFVRMWRYYLNYCEVGFRFGSTDVGLLACKKV